MAQRWLACGEWKTALLRGCEISILPPLHYHSSHPILKAPGHYAAASPASSSPPSLPTKLAKLAMNHATKEIVVFVAGVDNAPEIPDLSGTHDPARACAYGIFYDSTRFNSYNTSHRRHVLPEEELWALYAVWCVSRLAPASWPLQSHILQPLIPSPYRVFSRSSKIPLTTTTSSLRQMIISQSLSSRNTPTQGPRRST